MNILVKVNFYVRESLVKALTDDGHGVFSVDSFSSAWQVYNENEIDCLVIDLHSDGPDLEKDYIKEAKGSNGNGNFSGYVWLKHYIYNNGENPEAEKEKAIIFCQGHYNLQEFKQKFSKKELEGVTIVDYLACVGKNNCFIDVVKEKISKLQKASRLVY